MSILKTATALLLFAATGNLGAQTVDFSTVDRSPFFYRFGGVLDRDVWQIAENTFDGSGSAFLPSEALSGDTNLSLRVRDLDRPRWGKTLSGATVNTHRYFGYGTFTVRMRAPIVPGTTGTFFLMNRWQPGNWFHKEIDVELLGKDRRAVQFNVHRFYSATQSAAGSPFVYLAPFDYGMDFHEYSIRWTKNKIEFFVDAVKVHEYTSQIPDEPLAIFLNHWAADPTQDWASDWLGDLDRRNLPSYTEYEWVRYVPEEVL